MKKAILVFAIGISQLAFFTQANCADNIIESNKKFTLKLYQRLQGTEENIFFSPYSISTAMAMAYEGSVGQTAKEIKSVFDFPDNIESQRESFLRMMDSFNKTDKEFDLKTANALWVQVNYKLIENYARLIQKYYDGKITGLDFIKSPQQATKIINQWVEDRTNHHIKDLIPQGYINVYTRLVLTNVVYFKSPWLTSFDKKLTRHEDFTSGLKNIVKVDMMFQHGHFNYGENEFCQILEIPYKGNELSMVIFLPKNADLSRLEAELIGGKLKNYHEMLNEEDILLHVPRFKFEAKYFLKKELMGMGMKTAFSNLADFSGITLNGSIFIDQVIHQAFVDVNEEGTEAAAATAVLLRLGGLAKEEPKIFYANHPFIFMIQQKATGHILFMGRVSNPLNK